MRSIGQLKRIKVDFRIHNKEYRSKSKSWLRTITFFFFTKTFLILLFLLEAKTWCLFQGDNQINLWSVLGHLIFKPYQNPFTISFQASSHSDLLKYEIATFCSWDRKFSKMIWQCLAYNLNSNDMKVFLTTLSQKKDLLSSIK